MWGGSKQNTKMHVSPGAGREEQMAVFERAWAWNGASSVEHKKWPEYSTVGATCGNGATQKEVRVLVP